MRRVLTPSHQPPGLVRRASPSCALIVHQRADDILRDHGRKGHLIASFEIDGRQRADILHSDCAGCSWGAGACQYDRADGSEFRLAHGSRPVADC